MTRDAAIDFFNKVKNIKIKRNNWDKEDKCFIPSDFWDASDATCARYNMKGELNIDGQFVGYLTFDIGNGFLWSADGFRWEHYDRDMQSQEDRGFSTHMVGSVTEIVVPNCNCDKIELMKYGCRCGSFALEMKKKGIKNDSSKT